MKKLFLWAFILTTANFFSCNGQEPKKAQELSAKLDSCKRLIDTLKSEVSSLKEEVKEYKDEIKNYKENFKSLIENSSDVAWRVHFKNKTFDVYIVDIRSNTIRFYLDDKQGKGKNYSFSDIEKKLKESSSRLVFAMNAGMYNPARKPVGLYIEDGKEIVKINREKRQTDENFYMQPNGVFYITKEKKAYIVETDNYKDNKDVVWATQSGPMLLSNGKINSNFRNGSPNLNIRNGVGIIDSTKVVFAISNQPVNFYDFSELFKNFFGCKNALYLDGAISKMYLPKLNRKDTGENLGPIITIIH